mgnify:CR=1 FL=1
MAKTNFREIAKKATELSELMNGREKIETGELIKKFPDGVTITAVDMIETAEATYPVILFKEDDSIFYTGGIVLKKIVDQWLMAFNGDSEKCSEELIKDGGVMVKLEETKTKKNQNVTKVTVL